MRKIILFMHTTLDGFVAGPGGEMNWIQLDDEMFDLVGTLTDEADTALYGRATYQMMDAYWPTAAHEPNATKHDIQHSTWYNNAEKFVISRTMEDKEKPKTTFIHDDIAGKIERLKNQDGKNIMIFGSPSVVHILVEHNLVDEYWLFINPVILGQGIPLFSKSSNKIELKLITSKLFQCGVAGLNYTMVR